MRRSVVLACVAVLVGVAIAHGGALSNGFVAFDDDEYVYENPVVPAGLSPASIAWAFRIDARGQYFHPLTWLSLMADAQAFGVNPRGFHAVNVALHGATAVLALLVLFSATGRLGASTAAALLFAVHPITVEAVGWVTERKTVLSAALGMAAMLAYVRHARRPSATRLALVAALLAASLLAKPGLVVFPVLALLLDFWPLGRLAPGGADPEGGAMRRRGLLAEKIPLAVVSGAGLALAIVSSRTSTIDAALPSLALRSANAIASVPRYVSAIFWPVGFSAFHPFPSEVPLGTVVAAATALAAATVVAAAAARRLPWLFVGWGWFLVTLSPYLGLKQSGLWPGWAERFAYLPLLGFTTVLAFEASELAQRARVLRAPLVAAAVLVAAVLGAATRHQVGHWKDSVTLFTRAVAVEPGAAVMRYNLAMTLARSRRFDEAAPQLEQAVQLAPGNPEVQTKLACVERDRGRPAEAERWFRSAMRLAPKDPEALYGLAQLLDGQGRAAEARPFFARFLGVAPPQYGTERALAARKLTPE
ncbi:MAG TPA: tetratricopeptide repeat protein [Anaeromyxobacter sp.]